MRDVLTLLVIFSAVPLIFLRPHVGILAWCWVSYMNPHRLSWGFAYEFPVAMVVGVATLLAWMLSKDPKKLQVDAVSGLLLAFVVWMTFANLFAMVPDLAFDKWTQCFKIILMTFVTMVLMQNRERLHAMIWVIVLSLGFFGAKGGLFTALEGGTSRVWGPPGTFITDNNALAMALIMALPLMRYLQVQSESKVIRIGFYVLMILTAFSIIGSQSRGAFLGGIAMAAFLVMKSRQRVMISLLVVGFITVGVFFVPQSWIDRMKTIETYQEDSSALSRLEVWGFALEIANKRPLVGGGFRVSYDDAIYLKYVPEARKGHGRNYHSVYFEILGELGYPGLLIYLSVLWAAWRSGSRVIAMTKRRPELHWAGDLARMIQVSLVGFVVSGAFQNLAFFDLYFHLIAMLFLARHIVMVELAKEETAADVPLAGPQPALARGALGSRVAGSGAGAAAPSVVSPAPFPPDWRQW